MTVHAPVSARINNNPKRNSAEVRFARNAEIVIVIVGMHSEMEQA